MWLAVVVSFGWRFLLNVSAFWTTDARGLGSVALAASMFLGGFVVPIRYFPDWLQPLVLALPFASITQTPADLFVERMQGVDDPGAARCCRWCGRWCCWPLRATGDRCSPPAAWSSRAAEPVEVAVALYVRLVGAQLRSQMQYKVSFLLALIGSFLVLHDEFGVVVVLFTARASCWRAGRWPKWRCCTACRGCASRLPRSFAAALDNFQVHIVRGTFDRVLVRPRGALFQVHCRRFCPAAPRPHRPGGAGAGHRAAACSTSTGPWTKSSCWRWRW